MTTSRARARTILALALLLVPMAVRTSPPVEPPYHMFYVFGTLTRTGGGNVQNYVIALADAQTSVLLREGAQPLSITTADGEFSVVSRTVEPPDSLALVVVLPGEGLSVAEVFARDSVEPSLVQGYQADSGGGSDGCCESNPEAPLTEPTIIGYVYHYPEKTIILP